MSIFLHGFGVRYDLPLSLSLALFQTELTERLLSPLEDALLLERLLGYQPGRASHRPFGRAERGRAQGRRRPAPRAGPGVPPRLTRGPRQRNRSGFGVPRASVGAQPELIGETGIWVVPNPSGLNAHYQLPRLIDAYRALQQALD